MEIITILKTAENVSSLDTSSYSVNVPKIPFEYVDKNSDVTETYIASMNGLNPYEIASLCMLNFVLKSVLNQMLEQL